jgi:CubicO group peptidase (beta-lactamase class C family)
MRPTFLRLPVLALLACFALVGPPSTLAAPQAAGAAPQATAACDAVLKRAVGPGGPGAAAIVVKDGKVVYRGAYGLADVELKTPLGTDSVFRLASVTKQFTSLAIMMLVDQGKIGLQDPIDKYLPGYPMQGHTITVEHLLTHTSGIQSYTDIPGYMATKVQADVSVPQLVDAFKDAPMQFAPGTRYRYNNSGYVLLGAIIEKVSGQPYASYVANHIFKPLGMTHSYYGTDEPKVPRLASGHTNGGKPARPLSMTQPYSAGGLLSTVDDLAKWDAALAAGRLLKPASFQRMWTPYKLVDGTTNGYGYGWQMATLRGQPTMEHGGGIFGFATYVMRVPEDHLYVAVLANTDDPPAPPAYIAKRLGAIAMGRPFAEPVLASVNARSLQTYTGLYGADQGPRRTVTFENDKLFVQPAGGSRVELKPRSKTEFFIENRLTLFQFEMDAAGKPAAVLVFQEEGGTPERVPRIGDGPPPPATRKEIKVDPAIYDAYVGEYELAPGFILSVTREGDRLMTQATGQGKVEIFPSAETEFFLKVVDAQVTFVKGPSGTVDSIVLHQNGRDLPAKRRK